MLRVRALDSQKPQCLPWETSFWSGGQGESKRPGKQHSSALLLVISQNLKTKSYAKDTSDTGPGGFKLELTWKTPPWELILIVYEDSNQAIKGEKRTLILPCCMLEVYTYVYFSRVTAKILPWVSEETLGFWSTLGVLKTIGTFEVKWSTFCTVSWPWA